MPLLILPILVVLVLIALVPISIVQRYRVGTSRQKARGWVIGLNVVGISISAALFLVGAAFTNFWVPDALRYTALGLAGGCALGLVGLWLTKWEPSTGDLHFTPNRWLVLAITLVVTARIAYGFWRGWTTWSSGVGEGSWFVTAGVAGAMAAGAVVLGYYLTFWLGVRRRFKRHAARPLRRISRQ